MIWRSPDDDRCRCVGGVSRRQLRVWRWCRRSSPPAVLPVLLVLKSIKWAMEWNLSAAACSLPGRVTGRLNPPASSASQRMIQIQVTCLDFTYWMLALGDLMPYTAILHGLAVLQRRYSRSHSEADWKPQSRSALTCILTQGLTASIRLLGAYYRRLVLFSAGCRRSYMYTVSKRLSMHASCA
ncbi:hypothetical protein V8C44DRAFT_214060 [Trichoderma aethiopicum]